MGRQEHQSSTKKNAKSFTWGEVTPVTSTHWGQPAGEHLHREKPEGCGGQQIEHKPVICPCSKGQQPSGLH